VSFETLAQRTSFLTNAWRLSTRGCSR